jgi:hypothetical protein
MAALLLTHSAVYRQNARFFRSSFALNDSGIFFLDAFFLSVSFPASRASLPPALVLLGVKDKGEGEEDELRLSS